VMRISLTATPVSSPWVRPLVGLAKNTTRGLGAFWNQHRPAFLLGAALMGLVTAFPWLQVWALANGFDPGKAGFSVKFKDEISPYRVTGMFVLPEETVDISVITPQSETSCTLECSGGAVTEQGYNQWTWQAPAFPGDLRIVVRNFNMADSVILNVFVMQPFSALGGEYLNNYRIGKYPSTPLRQLSIYQPPIGFIEVTEENLSTAVGPHFSLGQFLCKQNDGFPKYMVLKERLILKLELILEKVNQAGYRCDTFHIMSGYRTPHYNRTIGNVEYSRHLWGGAADLFIDTSPQDCMMDDLNSDGKIDYRDAEVIYDIIDDMYGKPWYMRFLGGLARYRRTSSHGPFVHVDVRGVRARWGD
jgi:hypothetical protein